MKKIAIAAVLLAVGFLLSEGHGQGRAERAPGKTVGSEQKAGAGKAAASRTDGKPVFAGRIVEVDAHSGTLRVKGKDATVAFDASNPIFVGYRSLSDVKAGDRVAVSYTADGIRVARLAGKVEEVERVGPPRPPAAGPLISAVPEKRPQEKKKLTRVQKKANGVGFADVDVNKDGKVAPVELSLVVPDITMDVFRQYDKDRNGCLDREEFTEALRMQKAAKVQ